MKQKLLTVFAAAFLFAACGGGDKKDDNKTAEEKGKQEEKKPEEKKPEAMNMPDSATMMKNWQEYMTPGEVHKMMAKWNGTWNGDVAMWMYPGSPEQKSKSTAVNKMIMNGLYQEGNHSGDMMGMPFNGKSIVAYDNHRKEFVSTWIDNMAAASWY